MAEFRNTEPTRFEWSRHRKDRRSPLFSIGMASHPTSERMKITAEQAHKLADRAVAVLDRAGKSADAVRYAAAKIEANANTIERIARPARRSLRTAATASWVDLLGRLFR